MHPEQGALMMHLWAVGPVRQSALAAHFGKDSAATTRTVQRLERAGYLRRRADPGDGRATLVEPTPAGNALRGRVEEIWGRLERVLEQAVPVAQRGAALDLLTGMADVVLAELDAEATRSLTEV
nr:MarR family winged helix-turn-helix transcriptional regulator [Kineococcus vitellinus]